MAANGFPIFIPPHHGSGPSPGLVPFLAFFFGTFVLIAGGFVTAIEVLGGDFSGWGVRIRRARRFRAALLSSVREAREAEDVLVRGRVVAPPGGLVPGWGDAEAAWTRLEVDLGRGCKVVEEQGEILVEIEEGALVSVSTEGLVVTGLPAPGVDPAVLRSFGGVSRLPARVAEIVRERGYPLVDEKGNERGIGARTDQLVPGEEVCLVGPIRSLHRDGTSGSSYRDPRGIADRASEGGDRFLVRAPTEAAAMDVLHAAARAPARALRGIMGPGLLAAAGLAGMIYGLASC